METKIYFSARYLFAFIAMLGLTVAFMMRACLSMVITRMVEHKNSNLVKPDKFHWSEEMQGLILSSFYWGYILTHIPGGVLSEKFGGKYIFGLGILITAILTLITPLVVNENPVYLIFLRFLEGVGEGFVFPSLYTLLARWAPPGEKGVISTLILLGGQVGTFLSNLLGGYILQRFTYDGWKRVFYYFGISGVVWYFLWQFLCYNDPQSHPFISKKETLYLAKEIGSVQRKKSLRPTPWKHLLTSGPVWTLIITEIGHDWGMYTIITDLPKYLNDALNYNPIQNGMISGFPYLSIIVMSWISSALNDWLLRKKVLSVPTLRKLFATISSVGPAVGMLCASYVHSTGAIVGCFILGMGCLAFCFSSIKINALDLSPNYSGSITACVNGCGCVSGILAPYIVGLLTPHRSIDEWRTVFWIMAIILITSNFIFVIFGSCKKQPWDDLDETDQKN